MQKNTTTYLVLMIAVAGISSILAASTVSMDTQTVSEVIVTEKVSGSLDNYTLDELASNSKYAIIGTVEKITPVAVEKNYSHEDKTYITIFSDIQVNVEQDLFGEYQENQISVRIHGGQLGDMKTEAELSPKFDKNERVLFFIADKELHTIWGDNYYVAGLYLGKYSLSDGYASRDKIDDKKTESELISIINQIKEN